MAPQRQPRDELDDRPPSPGEQMLDGSVNRNRDDGEPRQNRNRIAVNRPDQTMQPVPAEAFAPVDVGLEHRERERRDEEERRQAQSQAV